MDQMTMAQSLNKALHELMLEDPNCLLLGEDIGVNGGVFRITENLQQTFGSQRVIDTPLAECMISGLSIGMAMKGLRPIAEFQFLAFMYPAFEQIASHASRIESRTCKRFKCPIIFRTPYGGGVGAPEHHSESTEALFASIPGLSVIIPSSPQRAYTLLKAAHTLGQPTLFLEPTRMYHRTKQSINTEMLLPTDKAIIESTGDHLTLISWGAMMIEARHIVENYKKHNIHIELIDLVSLRPLDISTIISSVQKTKRCMIIQESNPCCSVGSELSAQLHEKLFGQLLAPVKIISSQDTVMPYSLQEKLYRPNINVISKKINEVLSWKN